MAINPAVIAILVAVKQELAPILRVADANHLVRQEHLDFFEGTLAGHPVALLALGVGKECARIAAEMTIKCYRPDLIISAGFGGALQDSIRHGDIVIGTEALDLCQDKGSQVRCRSTHQLFVGTRLPANDNQFHLHYGKMLTTDDMVLKAANKKHLGTATGALTVDMETSAVATVAAAHGTDMLAVRCITDSLREDLPDEFNDFFVVGQLQLSRVLAACNRDPRIILDLARLGYRAKVAGDILARFLLTTLPRLREPAFAST